MWVVGPQKDAIATADQGREELAKAEAELKWDEANTKKEPGPQKYVN